MNTITSALGVLIIIAAASSVFLLDDVSWTEASFGIASGAGLIYVKNNNLVAMIRPTK